MCTITGTTCLEPRVLSTNESGRDNIIGNYSINQSVSQSIMGDNEEHEKVEGKVQDVNDESRSSPSPPDSTELQPEEDSERDAENGHDTTVVEEEDRDGGVKVHDDEDEDGQTNITEGAESGEPSSTSANSHGIVGEQQQPEHEEEHNGPQDDPTALPNQGAENAEEAQDPAPSTLSASPIATNDSTEPTACAENTQNTEGE